MTTKICNRCEIEKDIKDFYSYKDGHKKSICKHCEINNSNKKDLYLCEICDITIRKASKNKHNNSYRHEKNRLWNEQYDFNKLQWQNNRGE